ncbi:MAG: DNA-processing protein DprA [Chromatocurvus sp.]
MDADVVTHCLLLQVAAGLSRAQSCCLLSAFSSTHACIEADVRCWRDAGLDASAVDALQRARDCLQGEAGASLRAMRHRLAALDVSAVALCDPGYPALLRSIDSPPPFLYVRGSLCALDCQQLAVVGSRRASAMGVRAARELAGDVAAAGLAVTSGLALGIDGAAHRGAIDAGGLTAAVMATGIDRVYPAQHRSLADAICESGCLISEFAPGTPPRREHFPRRNRLISGLALGTLVVEADLPSGSLITANTALNQGREVLTLPWSIYHGNGRGCLQLLRDGAVLVQTSRDITDVLGQLPPPIAKVVSAGEEDAKLSDCARQLVARLDDVAVDADSLAAVTDLPLQCVITTLTELEMAGCVQRCAGGYVRCR